MKEKVEYNLSPVNKYFQMLDLNIFSDDFTGFTNYKLQTPEASIAQI